MTRVKALDVLGWALLNNNVKRDLFRDPVKQLEKWGYSLSPAWKAYFAGLVGEKANRFVDKAIGSKERPNPNWPPDPNKPGLPPLPIP